jgi:hypothetical protein
MNSDEYRAYQIRRLVAAVRDGIAGRVGVIEGSLLLLEYRNAVTRDDLDPDFRIFTVVNSETDHLPIGEVRK